MERENEMIVISHRLFVFVIPFKAFIVSANGSASGRRGDIDKRNAARRFQDEGLAVRWCFRIWQNGRGSQKDGICIEKLASSFK